jgi:hypothetical protein
MRTPRVPRIGYPVLAACLAGLFLVPPHFSLLHPGAQWQQEGLLFRALYALLMLAALVPVARDRRAVVIGLVLALPVLFTDWGPQVFDGLLARLLAYFAFTSYVGVNMLRALMRARHADFDTICAAVCLYLVAALNWAFLYCVLDLLAPGSFNLPADLAGQQRLESLIYYSFVTIASLGYGDILPLTGAARMWAAAEVVYGQFYLAIVLARLVALYMLHPQD